MTAENRQGLIPLEIPIMYVQPHRSFAYLYASLENAAALERLRQSIAGDGGAVRAILAYEQPDRHRFLAAVVVDVTDSRVDPPALAQELEAAPGVEILGSTATQNGLGVSTRHTLQVAGVPMAVVAREVLGGIFKQVTPAAGPEVIYRIGLEMGKQAASTVPALLNQLDVPLTLDLLRQRVNDFQVFGWALVRQVNVDTSLHGQIELEKSFESSVWNGQAPTSTCNFLRGFTVGVFSFAFNRRFESAEPKCQGKGDSCCQITFQPVAG